LLEKEVQGCGMGVATAYRRWEKNEYKVGLDLLLLMFQFILKEHTILIMYVMYNLNILNNVA
jgi:hypothetical protein